ncbi:MAG: VanZ family protein [Planctomycetes bacterium]|nr:VanZ family protein [Planctomycetota bacterium]
MRIRTLIWVFLFGCAFTATHLPPSNLPSAPWISDKAEHALGFAVLGFVTCWRFGACSRMRGSSEASGQTSRRDARGSMGLYLKMALFLAAYALVDESTQPWVGRSCEALDWVADMFGAAIGLLAGGFCFHVRGASR